MEEETTLVKLGVLQSEINHLAKTIETNSKKLETLDQKLNSLKITVTAISAGIGLAGFITGIAVQFLKG